MVAVGRPAKFSKRAKVNRNSACGTPKDAAKFEEAAKAKRCVSDPIVTPVTDEFPTEDSKGQWVAPEAISAEEKQKQTPNIKKCLSDPIVTPVTDEFPSEESRLWVAPKEVGAEKDQTSVRKDYYADGNVHKGDKRIVSDPIVTPCTDEYPTEKDEKAVIKREVKIKPALEQKHKPKTVPKTYSPTTSTGFSGTCTQTSNDRSLRRAKLVRSNELVEARAGAGKQPEAAPTEQNSRRKSTASKETTRGRRRKARKFKHAKKEKINNVIETVTKVPTPSPKTPRAKKTPVAN